MVEGDPDRWSAETEILLFVAARRERFVLLGAMGYLAVVGIAGAVSMVAQWKDGKTLYAKALEINPRSTWALQNDTYISYLQNDALSHDQRLAALRRQSVLLDAVAQGVAGDAEGARGAADIPAVVLQRALQGVPLDVAQRARRGGRRHG